MEYPKRIIKKGEANKTIVRAIQKKLNEQNCGPIAVDGDFGNQTLSAVKLFQTWNLDAAGTPLKADGQIGAITWEALFGADTLASNEPGSALMLAAIAFAATQLGVEEQPRLSNRGPEVDQYLLSVGLNPVGHHYSWCAAFVYYCFKQAALQLNTANPVIKTAGVLDHWNRARCEKISRATALADPSRVKPGSIFIIDHGNNLGHTGIVTNIIGGNLTTIEGNTNSGLSREGYGVFKLTRRKVSDKGMKGFLNYV